jgi:hypothetical protein
LSVITSANPNLKENPWFESIELPTTIIDFVAFVFFFQAIYLAQYALSSGRQQILAVRTTVSDLLEQYNDVKNQICNHYLKHFNNMFSSQLQFWDIVEFKMVEEFFLKTHSLPRTFDFAKYTGKLFISFIAKLGDVSITTCFAISIFVIFNFIRAVALQSIDRNARECHDGDRDLCQRFLVQYCFTCGMLINLYFLFIYVITYRQFLTMVACSGKLILSRAYDDIELNDRAIHDPEKKLECLKQIQEMNSSIEIIQEKFSFQRCDSDYGKSSKSLDQPSPIITSKNRKDDMEMIRNEMLKQTLRKSHNNEMKKSRPIIKRSISILTRKYSQFFYDEDVKEINRIFLCNSPHLYFWTIEFAFFIMCFYIATMLTQILPSFINRSSLDFAIGWTLLLLLPIVLASFQVPAILKRAVILKAVAILDIDVMHETVNEIIEEEGILDEVRNKIMNRMDDTMDDPAKVKFIREEFDDVCHGHDRMYKKQCRDFLGQLKVYLTKEKLDILWKVLDNDLSGFVTWDEVLLFVLPDISKSIQKDLAVLEILKTTIAEKFIDEGYPREEWSKIILQAFGRYDADGSGDIDQEEFEQILKDLEVFHVLKDQKLSFWVFTYGSHDANRLNCETYMKLLMPHKDQYYSKFPISMKRASSSSVHVVDMNSNFNDHDELTKEDDDHSSSTRNGSFLGFSRKKNKPKITAFDKSFSTIDTDSRKGMESSDNSISSRQRNFLRGTMNHHTTNQNDIGIESGSVRESPTSADKKTDSSEYLHITSDEVYRDLEMNNDSGMEKKSDDDDNDFHIELSSRPSDNAMSLLDDDDMSMSQLSMHSLNSFHDFKEGNLIIKG